jgi:hypothetical protein
MLGDALADGVRSLDAAQVATEAILAARLALQRAEAGHEEAEALLLHRGASRGAGVAPPRVAGGRVALRPRRARIARCVESAAAGVALRAAAGVESAAAARLRLCGVLRTRCVDDGRGRCGVLRCFLWIVLAGQEQQEGGNQAELAVREVFHDAILQCSARFAH